MNKRLLDQIELKEIKEIPVFFVMGSPRSGTTMLQHMLDANPTIQIPLESKWIIRLHQQFAQVKHWNKEIIDTFINALYERPFFTHLWNVESNYLRQHLYNYNTNDLNYATIIKVVYLSYSSIFSKTTINWIGDKNPDYAIYIQTISELFPEAKFIHIVRDYRPNILSNKKWFLKKNVAVLARKWVVYNQYIERKKLERPEHFITIKYEELVAEPTLVLKDVSDFLNIPFYKEMTSYHTIAKAAYLKSVNEEQKQFLLEGPHKRVFTPVTNEHLNDWKKSMSKKDVEIADYIAGQFGSRYGYERISTKNGLGLWLNHVHARLFISFENTIKKIYHKYTGPGVRRGLKRLSLWIMKLFGLRPQFSERTSQV